MPARICFNRFGGTCRSSPFSPIFDAHPEGQRGAGDRSGRRQQRHRPTTSIAQARGKDDHDGVDAEGQREEERRVEKGKGDDAERGREEAEDPAGDAAHRVLAEQLRASVQWVSW